MMGSASTRAPGVVGRDTLDTAVIGGPAFDGGRRPAPRPRRYPGGGTARPPPPAAPQARRGGQHANAPATSGRELGAALGPAGREDRPPRAGAHAQPEAVGLRAPAVVRLEGALAHVSSPSSGHSCTQ